MEPHLKKTESDKRLFHCSRISFYFYRTLILHQFILLIKVYCTHKKDELKIYNYLLSLASVAIHIATLNQLFIAIQEWIGICFYRAT